MDSRPHDGRLLAAAPGTRGGREKTGDPTWVAAYHGGPAGAPTDWAALGAQMVAPMPTRMSR